MDREAGGEELTDAERLLRDEGRWEELEELYLGALGETTEAAVRQELSRRLGRLYENDLHDVRKAYAALQRAFEEAPGDDLTAEALAHVARRLGAQNDLLAFCNGLLGASPPAEVEAELLARLGSWYQDALHADYAESCLTKALRLRPDHPAALASLATLYRGRGAWELLERLLTHAATAAGSEEARVEACASLGELYELTLGDRDRASVSYEAALGLDPCCSRASDGLRRVARTAEERALLVSAYERQLEAGCEPERAAANLRFLGEAYADELGDAARAIEAFRALLDLEPDDGRALKRLDGLLTREERWAELAPVLERRAALATSDRERVHILLLLALTLEDQLGEPRAAAARLEEVLAVDGDNEIAFDSLERLYRELEEWSALAATYARHVEASEDPAVLVPLYRELAALHEERLEDPLAAIEALEAACHLDPRDAPTLGALARALERTEDWVGAETALTRLLELQGEPAARVEASLRLARLLAGPLEEPTAAVRCLRRALELDPTRRETLEALRAVHEAQEEWHEVVLVLEAMQDLEEDRPSRARLLVELAELNEARLDHPERALECYELAAEQDPGHAEAAARLAERYVAERRFDEAAPLLDRALAPPEEGTSLGPERAHGLQLLRADVARARGETDAAMTALEAAASLGPADAATLRGIADLHLAKGAWEEAARGYQRILAQHREALGPEGEVEVLHRLGVARLRVGERRKALNLFDKALELDPAHGPTHEELLRFHETNGDFRAVLRHRKALLAPLAGPARVAALVEAADLAAERLEDLGEAIACIEEARSTAPDDLRLLHRLVDLTTAAGRWAAAVEAIERILELEGDPARLARYHRTLAVLHRDKLGEPDLAVEHFEACLDRDPTQLKSFEAIDRILTERKEWPRLEKAYVRMIGRARASGDAALLPHLFHFLGEIQRTRLGELEEAAESFRAADALEPGSYERQVILAELYDRTPAEAARAIEAHQRLLARAPTRLASYQALRAHYQRTEQYDKAFCLCSALDYVGKASPDERLFFSEYRALNVQRARGALTREQWVEDLFAPAESVHVGKVFETIVPALRRRRAQPTRAFGLRKKDLVPLDGGPDTLGGAFLWAAHSLGMAPPELYLKRDQADPLLVAPSDPPASIAGPALFGAAGVTPELRFDLGRHLALYRGEHYVLCLEPTIPGLRGLLLAAIHVARPEAPLPPGDAGPSPEAEALLRESLAPVEAEALRHVVDRLLRTKAPIDLEAWAAAVDETALRAGLLLSADIHVAAAAVERLYPPGSPRSAAELIAGLVAFSVSERYFRLRAALGFTIEQDRVL